MQDYNRIIYPQDLITPQARAVTQGKQPYIDPNQLLRAQLPAYREQVALQRQTEIEEEARQIQLDSQRRRERSEIIGLGIKGAEIGYQASRSPAVRGFASRVSNVFSQPSTRQSMPGQTSELSELGARPTLPRTSESIMPTSNLSPVPIPSNQWVGIQPSFRPARDTSFFSDKPPTVPSSTSATPVKDITEPTTKAFDFSRKRVSPTVSPEPVSPLEAGASYKTGGVVSKPSTLGKFIGYKGMDFGKVAGDSSLLRSAAGTGINLGLGAAVGLGLKETKAAEKLQRGLGFGGEKEWNTGISALSGFVFGGPLGAGVSLATAGIGALDKKYDWGKKIKKWF